MRLKIILAISLIAFSPAMASRGLVVAALEGDTAAASLLLESGDDPNSATPEGATPLAAAAGAGNVEIIELLLAAGASVNQLGVDKLGPEAEQESPLTPLNWAAIGGHLEAVKVLLAAGADPNIKSPEGGGGALLAATGKNCPEIAKLLLENGADPNSATIDGHTPLEVPILRSDLGMAKILLEAGADPNLVLDRVVTVDNPLASEGEETITIREPEIFWAFIPTSPEPERQQMVELLVEYGADPNVSSKGKWLPFFKIPAGSTPLHLAANLGWVSTVAKLIQAGADVNAVDNFGASPLHHAAENGDVDTIKILLAAGAQVNLFAKGESATKKPIGISPLYFAANGGHLEAAQLLLEHGADPNPGPYPGMDEMDEIPDGLSALHWAALHQQPDLVKLLVDAGAKVDIVGEFSFTFGGPDSEPVKKLVVAGTPLAASAMLGKDPETIRILVQAGADPNFPVVGISDPNLSLTPLHLTVIQDHPESLAALIELGAQVDAPDNAGMTALHWSAWRGAAEPARLLLGSGADPTLKDQKGKIPLDYARESGNSELVTLLEMAMANKN